MICGGKLSCKKGEGYEEGSIRKRGLCQGSESGAFKDAPVSGVIFFFYELTFLKVLTRKPEYLGGDVRDRSPRHRRKAQPVR